MVHQLGKQGKRWLIRSYVFHCTFALLNSLQALLIDFIKSLILPSTQLKAEKPLIHGPKGKPSAETEKASSTAQSDILRAQTMFSLPRRPSTYIKPCIEPSLAITESWKKLLQQGPEHWPGSSLGLQVGRHELASLHQWQTWSWVA